MKLIKVSEYILLRCCIIVIVAAVPLSSSAQYIVVPPTTLKPDCHTWTGCGVIVAVPRCIIKVHPACYRPCHVGRCYVRPVAHTTTVYTCGY